MAPLNAERVRRSAVGVALLVIGYLLFRVVEPFAAALAWAVIFVLALWPLYRRLRGRLLRPAWAAPTLMVFGITFVILVPTSLFAVLAFGEAERFAGHAEQFLRSDDQELTRALEGLPFIGETLARAVTSWRSHPEGIDGVLKENVDLLVSWASRAATNVGRNVFKLAVCLFTMWFLFFHGDSLRNQVLDGVHRLGGKRGERLLNSIRTTVRAVVYGLVMTALAQAMLTMVGFWLAGSPYPILLGALMFVFSFIPFGPPLIWGPAAVPFFLEGRTGVGITMVVYGAAIISSVDNVLRPLFIGAASKLPVLLVFMGVIGGVTAFGMVGLFVGPVVIAVALALWREWLVPIQDGAAPAPPVTVLP